MLHLLRQALAELAAPAGSSAPPGPCQRNLARAALRAACQAQWTGFNDMRLLQGVLLHGYGRCVGWAQRRARRVYLGRQHAWHWHAAPAQPPNVAENPSQPFTHASHCATQLAGDGGGLQPGPDGPPRL